ncbi:hypothetical protein F4802DRAFT_619562 [Xylaria palmicola]|nr:hypothetical protein F4802DRAFT_619562 [Xylaria palmicola]
MNLNLIFGLEILLGLGHLVLAQVQLHNITGTVPGLSSTCVQVLNQAVNCDASLLKIGLSRFEKDATLSKLCTATCTSALTNFLRRVNGACGTSRYDGDNGFSYLASYYGETVWETYQTVCLKDPQGNFCNAVARDALGVDPQKGVITALPQSSAACNSCVLSSFQFQLQQPLLSASDSSSGYSTLTSACKITTMTPTKPVSNTWISSPAPTSKPCDGTTYVVKSGDTCQSVSFGQGINTFELLTANKLLGYCRNFPSAGASLCIPSSKLCKPYSLKTGDTCRSIASANDITWTQLVAWNADIGDYCDGIDKMIGEHLTVCVSNPGGEWVNPSPGNGPNPTETASTTDTIFTTPMTPYTNFPPAPTTVVAYPNEEFVPPYGNGTLLDCAAYAVAPVLVDGYAHKYSYSCNDTAVQYGITLSNLQEWNPGALETADYGEGEQCYLPNGRQICVQRHPYAQSQGITEYCINYQVPPPGFDCGFFSWRWSANVSHLMEWNPALDCTNSNLLQKGIEYCVAVKHFRPAGQISICNLWALANDTDRKTKSFINFL